MWKFSKAKSRIHTLITLGSGVLLQSTCPSLAQSYEETLNFIFNGNKQWSSVSFQTTMSNQLTNYNQENCTVDLISTPYRRRGTIILKALTRWNWKPELSPNFGDGLAGQAAAVMG
jgi:hypothetical protein